MLRKCDRCGVLSERAICQSCTKRVVEYRKKRRMALRESGLCKDCGKKAAAGMARCKLHLERQRRTYRRTHPSNPRPVYDRLGTEFRKLSEAEVDALQREFRLAHLVAR